MENKRLTLGSLFDGSGGFPLAGSICGIEPVWASEIEPFPIKVTKKNFPNMKHLGNINRLNGAEIEPVGIITFGSPCQDLSVAGRRAGLSGSQSNLFFQAIRIIREMREATYEKHPKYAIGENVAGAFSSNKGQDFLAVLQSFAKTKDKEISIPQCEKGANSGEIQGRGGSLAGRVFDAQYGGVPQRRRRIFLVCDFDGCSAGKVLFKQESMSRYFKQSGETWKNITRNSKTSPDLTSKKYGLDAYNCAISHKAPTLGVNCGMSTGRNQVFCIDQGAGKSSCNVSKDVSPVLTTTHGGELCILDLKQTSKESKNKILFENYRQDCRYDQKTTSSTITAKAGTGGDNLPYVLEENKKGKVFAIAENNINRSIRSGCGGIGIKENTAFTLNCLANKGICDNKYIIRRLTPLECCRLQGFPDGWCKDLETKNPTNEEIEFGQKVFDTGGEICGLKKRKTKKQIRSWLGKKHTDSAEYKMGGNGVALPCVLRVLSGIVEVEEG